MDDRDASAGGEEFTAKESAYELLFCMRDLMALYCRQHEKIYGTLPPELESIKDGIDSELEHLTAEINDGN